MNIGRFILLSIYVFWICGNSSYGKGWITDFLFLAVYIVIGIWNYLKKEKNSSFIRKLKELDILSGIAIVIYAHFFMGSNGIRNPYGLLNTLFPSVIYLGIWFGIWLIEDYIWNKL